MIKKSQLFGWDQEPVDERPSEFMHSTSYGTLSDARTLGVESPAQAAPPNRPIDWAAKRDAPSARDHTLSAVARAWVDTLPASQRPLQLCSHYPRIANRLALCWPDPALTNRLFESLFLDQRGGRRGFPADVIAELVALRQLASQRPGA